MNFVHSCVWQLFSKTERWDEMRDFLAEKYPHSEIFSRKYCVTLFFGSAVFFQASRLVERNSTWGSTCVRRLWALVRGVLAVDRFSRRATRSRRRFTSRSPSARTRASTPSPWRIRSAKTPASSASSCSVCQCSLSLSCDLCAAGYTTGCTTGWTKRFEYSCNK